MSIKKVVPGQNFEIMAKEWNDISDTVKFVDDRQQILGGDSIFSSLLSGEVLIENVNSKKLDPGDIVAIPMIAMLPESDEEKEMFEANSPVLEAVLFSEDAEGVDIFSSPIGIVKKGLDNDEVGKAIVFGVAPVKLEIKNASHEYAKPENDTKDHLVTAFAGPCKILWKQDGTGKDKLGVVLLQHLSWINLKPEKPYKIDRSEPDDDDKSWHPQENIPEDWEDYDGLWLKIRTWRYTPGTDTEDGKLENIDTIHEWLTERAPIVSIATVTIAPTSTCDE